MKILYLLQDIPYPLTNGVRVKVFNLISYMARSHECHILSFGEKDLYSRALGFQEKVSGLKIINLFPLCSRLKLQSSRTAHFIHGEPIFLARWESMAFNKALQQALSVTRYDAIHLDGLGMAPYIHLCRSIPTVISTTDAMSMFYAHAARASHSFLGKVCRFYESKSILRMEREILPLFSKVHVVGMVDRNYLASCVSGADVEYITHVVPDEVLRYPHTASTDLSVNKRILFTGSLKSESIALGLRNFLSDVYPIIYRECPCVEMVILGQSTPTKLKKEIQCVPGVRLLEWVEDYFAELMRAQVLIFSDWSRTGVKTRVLYGLGLGKAVVATPEAVEGIEAKDGVHCFVRTVGRGFAEAVVTLLKDHKLRKVIGENARRLIHDKYSIESMGPEWVKLYESAIIKNKQNVAENPCDF